MLTALLSDIHGNREALVACLQHARALGAVHYVFLGDLVGYGADPGFVVDTVAAYVEQGARVVSGNHEAAVLGPDERLNPAALAAVRWTRDTLTTEHKRFLAELPLSVQAGFRLFVHASAWRPEQFDYVTGPVEAARSFGATNSRETYCGHVHVPMLFNLSSTGKMGVFQPTSGSAIPLLAHRRWLAVLGSVGQPRDRDPAASYAMLDEAAGTLTYLRVPYDVETAARKIRAAGLPPWLADRLERGV